MRVVEVIVDFRNSYFLFLEISWFALVLMLGGGVHVRG